MCIRDRIYGGKGYYIDYGDEKTKNRVVWKILGIIRGKYPPTPETVMAIIEGLVACELFSGDLFKSGILSSKRIQEQFYQATVCLLYTSQGLLMIRCHLDCTLVYVLL